MADKEETIALMSKVISLGNFKVGIESCSPNPRNGWPRFRKAARCTDCRYSWSIVLELFQETANLQCPKCGKPRGIA